MQSSNVILEMPSGFPGAIFNGRSRIGTTRKMDDQENAKDEESYDAAGILFTST